MSELRILAHDLKFPEGPVAMDDGSVILGEIAGGTVTRITPDGRVDRFSNAGGGPNGLAIGPDGALYCCNNGGNAYAHGGFLSTGPSADYTGGSIQRIDPRSGEARTLYTHCGRFRLSAPNDIVFDTNGGFYFTDLGKRRARDRDHGGLYYATPDGGKIVEIAHPIVTANGVGLSPDGKIVYVADTEAARLWAFDLDGPGVRTQRAVPIAARWAAGRRARRFPALRQPGGGRQRQHLCRDLAHRLHHCDLAGRAGAAAGEGAGRVPDEYLLRRQGHADGVYYAVGGRAVGGNAVA